MKIKIKQGISDLIDGENSKLDLEEILKQMERDPKIAQLYSDYLFVGNCMRGEAYSTKNDISASVMQAIKPRKKILKFSPKYAPQLAIAASTFLAITIGVYFYTPKENYIAESSLQKLELNNSSAALRFDQNFFDKVDNLSATDKLNLMPSSALDFTNTIKPDDIYISPLSKNSIYEVSAVKE